MNIVVIGAGRMGSQIGSEYAFRGHEVTFVAQDAARAQNRIDRAFKTAERFGLPCDGGFAKALTRVRVVIEIGDALDGVCDIAVESVPEDIELKAKLLRTVGELAPDAVIATNTSSLRISVIGEMSGTSERIVGTHYWNPPLLMPLVELVPGASTRSEVTKFMESVLKAIGKRPIRIEKDLPGFVWNRLQLALLREATWIVSNGVATAGDVDTIVRDGLARRSRFAGPFETVAIGGVETWVRMSEQLLPELSNADRVDELAFRGISDVDTEALIERRDAGLAADRS